MTARGRRVVSSLNLINLIKKSPCVEGLGAALTTFSRQRCLSAPRGFLSWARRSHYNFRMDRDLRKLAEEVEIRLHPDILVQLITRSRDFQEYVWKVLFPSNRRLVFERLPAGVVQRVLRDRDPNELAFCSGYDFNPGYFAANIQRPDGGNYGQETAYIMAYTLAEQERVDDDLFYETYPQP